MITSNISVTISYDKVGGENLRNALNTIRELEDAFGKSGGYVSNEIETLEHAQHIINEVLMGESF